MNYVYSNYEFWDTVINHRMDLEIQWIHSEIDMS